MANLLTIPCELRNAIYLLIFEPDSPIPDPQADQSRLDMLRTCKRIHQEASSLALSKTSFRLSGERSYPDLFSTQISPLPPHLTSSLRHLILTARISNLRALNEAWCALPFGHPSLRLDKLTLIPQRPDATQSCWGEIADLSQCHTLGYILAETSKGLRNVRSVEVRNEGCFNEGVWRIVYKSFVMRLWRWGGCCCGVKLQDSEVMPGEMDGFFRVHLQSYGSEKEFVDMPGLEVGDEICRLAEGQTFEGQEGAAP